MRIEEIVIERKEAILGRSVAEPASEAMALCVVTSPPGASWKGEGPAWLLPVMLAVEGAEPVDDDARYADGHRPPLVS